MHKEGPQIRSFNKSVADSCIFLKGSNKNTASKLSSLEFIFADCGYICLSIIRTPGGNAIICQFRKDDKDITLLVYVDVCIILSCNKDMIAKIIASLTFRPKMFEFIDEGELSKYRGGQIEQLRDSGFSMTQPFLIQCLIVASNIDMPITNP